eukprot:m.332759 g.332759  ORF g.332759 m.332759 type:complete len:85 (+) comp16061_c1_seq8:1296-1550(+)
MHTLLRRGIRPLLVKACKKPTLLNGVQAGKRDSLVFDSVHMSNTYHDNVKKNELGQNNKDHKVQRGNKLVAATVGCALGSACVA